MSRNVNFSFTAFLKQEVNIPSSSLQFYTAVSIISDFPLGIASPLIIGFEGKINSCAQPAPYNPRENSPVQTKDCIASQFGCSAVGSWDFWSQTSEKRVNETVKVLVIHLLISLFHKYLLNLYYMTATFLVASETVVSKTKSLLF